MEVNLNRYTLTVEPLPLYICKNIYVYRGEVVVVGHMAVCSDAVGS